MAESFRMGSWKTVFSLTPLLEQFWSQCDLKTNHLGVIFCPVHGCQQVSPCKGINDRMWKGNNIQIQKHNNVISRSNQIQVTVLIQRCPVRHVCSSHPHCYPIPIDIPLKPPIFDGWIITNHRYVSRIGLVPCAAAADAGHAGHAGHGPRPARESSSGQLWLTVVAMVSVVMFQQLVWYRYVIKFQESGGVGCQRFGFNSSVSRVRFQQSGW